eukprot:m.91407 g.91407  ORF g.91407 m.91407 type:complete len:256 (-) comp8601_c0_seq4:152-919(-)
MTQVFKSLRKAMSLRSKTKKRGQLDMNKGDAAGQDQPDKENEGTTAAAATPETPSKLSKEERKAQKKAAKEKKKTDKQRKKQNKKRLSEIQVHVNPEDNADRSDIRSAVRQLMQKDAAEGGEIEYLKVTDQESGQDNTNLNTSATLQLESDANCTSSSDVAPEDVTAPGLVEPAAEAATDELSPAPTLASDATIPAAESPRPSTTEEDAAEAERERRKTALSLARAERKRQRIEREEKMLTEALAIIDMLDDDDC